MPDVFLRAATAEDQTAIRRIDSRCAAEPIWLALAALCRGAGAASRSSEIVGIGQVKILGDGTPELASLAVLPEYQDVESGQQHRVDADQPYARAALLALRRP